MNPGWHIRFSGAHRGSDHVMFDAQSEYLRARGYRVVTWDLRGHGLSRPAGVRFTAEQAIADLCAGHPPGHGQRFQVPAEAGRPHPARRRSFR
ncbi:hypothetical protein GCM10023075_46090 [Streptosporangium album]